MKIMQTTAMAVAIAVGIGAGCTNRFADGYQFGDVTLTVMEVSSKIKQAQNVYCTVTTEEQRATAIATLEGMGIEYGQSGFCGLSVAVILDHYVPGKSRREDEKNTSTN